MGHPDITTVAENRADFITCIAVLVDTPAGGQDGLVHPLHLQSFPDPHALDHAGSMLRRHASCFPGLTLRLQCARRSTAPARKACFPHPQARRQMVIRRLVVRYLRFWKGTIIRRGDVVISATSPGGLGENKQFVASAIGDDRPAKATRRSPPATGLSRTGLRRQLLIRTLLARCSPATLELKRSGARWVRGLG